MKLNNDHIINILAECEEFPTSDNPEWIALCREVLAARAMRDSMGPEPSSGFPYIAKCYEVEVYDKARNGMTHVNKAGGV